MLAILTNFAPKVGRFLHLAQRSGLCKDFGSQLIRPLSMSLTPSYPKPCRIGDLVEEVDTPALVVCLDQLEENFSRMKKAMAKYPGIALRPHVKTHKCPDIAKLQVGFVCAE
jgi:hypothetical protein